MLWTKWCPGQVEPSARGMNSIAASATGALDLTRVRLLRLLAAGANDQLKSAVWQRPGSFQYRPYACSNSGPAVVATICPTRAYKGTGQIQVILYAKRLFQVADLNLSLGQPTGARGFGQ